MDALLLPHQQARVIDEILDELFPPDAKNRVSRRKPRVRTRAQSDCFFAINLPLN